MAKTKVKGEGKTGRPPLSASGKTKPTTFRIPPATMAAIRGLSDRLDLRSQAGAIELATRQLLTALERCDARPPLTSEQLDLTTLAVRAAGLEPRRLGASANYPANLLATIIAAEVQLVPGECSAKEYDELVEVVKKLDPAAALWAIGAAIRG